MVKPHSLNNRKPFSTPHSQCFVLQPQIQPMEEGAGMPPRRSASLHPQIQPSGDSAGASSRHSPCLYPQIQAIEEGAGVTCRRSRGTSRAAAASLPDDDGMLWEILLRLPPQPSSLPRASAVCKRWRCIVGDPKFHRQFYAHHRKPPLLGVFECNFQRIVFTPVLDPPNHIPPQRFDLGRYSSGLPYRQLLDCRHGRILIEDRVQKEVIVCDPITGDQRRLTIPLEFKRHFFNGSVLCAAGDQGHVHGGCHSSPFKVVLMSICKDTQPIASVYSSENGLWGNLISAETRCEISRRHAVLVSNRLYWVSMDDGILEFDLGDHSLTVIKGPPVTNDIISLIHTWIIQAEHGAVGYAILSYPRFHMWQRNVNGHGVATWVPWKTIEMDSILKLPPQTDEAWAFLLGYDEDSDVIFLSVNGSVYTVQLKSMQSRKLHETADIYRYFPFKSFYTPAIAGGFNGAEMLHVG